MPALVVLLLALGDHERAIFDLKLLAIYWAVMGPLLLLQRQLDRKKKESGGRARWPGLNHGDFSQDVPPLHRAESKAR
jgi:hypothetical protein